MSRKITSIPFATIWITSLIGFVLMWLVIGNLGVLPYGILPATIPLSMLEAFVAAWIVKKHS